jgi:hypothetical protein
LSCILDIVDVPEIVTESVNDEDDFRKILDWCDIWILLLTTTGKSIRFLVLIRIQSVNMYVTPVYQTCVFIFLNIKNIKIVSLRIQLKRPCYTRQFLL